MRALAICGARLPWGRARTQATTQAGSPWVGPASGCQVTVARAAVAAHARTPVNRRGVHWLQVGMGNPGWDTNSDTLKKGKFDLLDC